MPLDPKQLGQYYALSQVGLEMVAPLVGGLVFDHYVGTEPWGAVVGALFGLVGGLGHLIALLYRKNDSSHRDEP